MSIEKLLTELKESVDRNTEALLAVAKGGAAPAASSEKTTAKKTTAKDDGPKIEQEQVNAALIKIKDEFGMDEAKKIIKEFGKVEKMGEIKQAQYKAVFDAAVAKYDELTAAASGGGGDDL